MKRDSSEENLDLMSGKMKEYFTPRLKAFGKLKEMTTGGSGKRTEGAKAQAPGKQKA